MAWRSFFYQSGMSGQESFRLPNGEDLPIPSPALWNGRSANIEVDYAELPPPYRVRIHYRVVINAYSSNSVPGLRTRHISQLAGEFLGYARDNARDPRSQV